MGNTQRKLSHHRPKLQGSTNAIVKKVHWDGPGVPSAPGKPILLPGDEDSQPDLVYISWERSTSNGGSAIIGYHVEHKKMGTSHWIRSAPVLCTYPELTLSGLEPGWRYQFRIRAQNALGMSEPSELSDPLTVTLQRTSALPPKFNFQLKNAVGLEGKRADFKVHFYGNPQPRISWYKDGFEIFNSRRTSISTDHEKSILIIHQISIDDEGEIKCTATNRAGHVSTKAKLTVEAPPRIRLPRQYDDGLHYEQGEMIRLKATASGRPAPSITWYHHGEIITNDERRSLDTITENESVLRIYEAKRDDRGEYSIRAINKLGEHMMSIRINVTDRPSPPGKVEIIGILGSSITLAWNLPEDDGGCKIDTYVVEYYRVGWDVWLKAKSCRKTTISLSDLIEASEYKFRVKAENPYGVSDPGPESDLIFIPDPRRGITEPNMREKSQSHRDIIRGRSERRELISRNNAPRSRSLNRIDESNSDQASPNNISQQTVNIGIDNTVVRMQQPKIVIAPPYDDSGGNDGNFEKITVIDKHDVRVKNHSHGNPSIIRRKKFNSMKQNLRSHNEDSIMTSGSSEFMLVLYPEEEQNEKVEEETKSSITHNPYLNQQSTTETTDNEDSRECDEEEGEENFSPLISLSLPDLFSYNYEEIEIFREAISSIELEFEGDAENEQRPFTTKDDMYYISKPTITETLHGNRSKTVKRHHIPIMIDNRRLSEGGISINVEKINPMQNVLSDPNISTEKSSNKTESEKYRNLFLGSGMNNRSNNSMDLSSKKLPDFSKERSPSALSIKSNESVGMKSDEILAEDSEETTGGSSEAESIDSEDLKQLKSRILAFPAIEEEETYHPRGRIVHNVESQVPSRNTNFDSVSRTPTRLMSPTPNETSTQPSAPIAPKSILKKRPELEQPLPPLPPLETHQIDRSSAPPEKPIRKNLRKDRDESDALLRNRLSSDLMNLVVQAGSITTPDQLQQTIEDEDAVISAAEAARNKRRNMKQTSRTFSSEIDSEELLEERMAVVSHYSEIMRDHSRINPFRSTSRDRDDRVKSFSRFSSYNSTDEAEFIRSETPTKMEVNSNGTQRFSDGFSYNNSNNSNSSTLEANQSAIENSSFRIEDIDLSRNKSPAPRLRNSFQSSLSRDASVAEQEEEILQNSNKATKKEDSHGRRRFSRPLSKDDNNSRPSTPSHLRFRKSKTPSRDAEIRRSSSNVNNNSNNTGNNVDNEFLAKEAQRRVQAAVSFMTDIGLLLVATYSYFFIRDIIALPFVALILLKYIHEYMKIYLSRWWRKINEKRWK